MIETIDKNSKQSPVIVNYMSAPKKSVCRVMKDNTVEAIQKLESEIPWYRILKRSINAICPQAGNLADYEDVEKEDFNYRLEKWRPGRRNFS